MSKELVTPNLHVVLVHFPLALLVAGLAVEILSVLYRRTTLRAAGRWMILLGALSAVPTALSGAYAFADVARRSMPPGERVDVPWYRVLRETRIHSSARSTSSAADPHAGESDQWKRMARHAWVQGPASGLAVLTVVVALALTDGWRRRLYLPLLLLLLAATGLMIWGAWYGGEMVYRYGTGVALSGRDDPPAPAWTAAGRTALAPDAPTAATAPSSATSTAPATEPATIPATAAAGDGTPLAAPDASMPASPATSAASAGAAGEQVLRKSLRSASYYLPPLQLHVILAGCAVALALAALGLSWRASARPRERADGVSEADLLRDQPDEPGRRRATPGDVAVLRSFKPDVALQVEPPEPVPAGRTWMLALLVTILAILAGWWFLAHASEAFDRSRAEHRPVTAVLWEQVTTAPDDFPAGSSSAARRPPWPTRRLAHVLAAGGIALVVLLLAATARWSRQRRGLVAACGLLLVLLVGVQLWLGVLLLFDTPAGSVYHFQRPPPAEVIATP